MITSPHGCYLFIIEYVLPDPAHLVNGEENEDDDEYRHNKVPGTSGVLEVAGGEV